MVGAPVTDAMAPMEVPQNYHELLPSGLRSLIMVRHYALRCVVINDENRIVYDALFDGSTAPAVIGQALALMLRMEG